MRKVNTKGTSDRRGIFSADFFGKNMEIIVLYFHWLDVHIVPAVAMTPFEALCLFTAVFKQQ